MNSIAGWILALLLLAVLINLHNGTLEQWAAAKFFNVAAPDQTVSVGAGMELGGVAASGVVGSKATGGGGGGEVVGPVAASGVVGGK